MKMQFFWPLKGRFFNIEMNFFDKKVTVYCNCRMTTNVGAIERLSFGDGFYILSCGHTTLEKFLQASEVKARLCCF